MTVNQQFEADVQHALSRFASGVTSGAEERLRRIDYRPRTSRLPAPVTVGALAGTTVTAGLVISVGVFGSAPAAFAGWTPVPSHAATLAAAVGSSCQAQLSATGAPGATTSGPWTPVTTDVRGPFTVVIYQDGPASATCFTGPSFTLVSQSSGGGNPRQQSGSSSTSGSVSGGGRGGGQTSILFANGRTGDVEHMMVAHLTAGSQGAYTLAEGQLAPGVTGVTLVRSDGADVVASTASGWFVAWWPGRAGVTSAQVATAGGVTTQPFDAASPPGVPPVGSESCSTNSGAASSSSAGCSGSAAGGGAIVGGTGPTTARGG
jgi:hypothetical protein